MRRLADQERIRRFLRALGAAASSPTRIYLTGGSTAVLMGWRPTTIDVDLRIEGNEDPILQAIPGLKEELQLNVELAAPPDFIPELPGWRERSPFIAQEGKLEFFHFDPYSQLLAKIERGHSQDLADVRRMIEEGLVDPAKARKLFEEIEPLLYRYPAIDPGSFRRAVEAALGKKK